MINTTEIDIDISRLMDRIIEFNYRNLKHRVEIQKYFLSETYEFAIGETFANTKYAFAKYFDGALTSYIDSIPKSYRKDAQKFLNLVLFTTGEIE